MRDAVDLGYKLNEALSRYLDNIDNDECLVQMLWDNKAEIISHLLDGRPAQRDDPFNRRQVEAVCRAVCTVEGVDPDSDVYGDSCDPQWTRYADAVAAALTPAERRCQKSRVKFIYPSDRECGCGEICENPGGKKCSAPADAVAAALTPADGGGK